MLALVLLEVIVARTLDTNRISEAFSVIYRMLNDVTRGELDISKVEPRIPFNFLE